MAGNEIQPEDYNENRGGVAEMAQPIESWPAEKIMAFNI